MKRVREFLESIAFAGLKPGGPAMQTTERRCFGPLQGALDRLLSGSAPNDPLYLTNRTLGQKLRSWMLIGIPCLILVVCVGIALSNLLDPPVKPTKELTAHEIAVKVLPNIAKDIRLAANHDIQVVEVSVRREGSPYVTGIVHNSTSRDIATVELVVDLTDSLGSQVGGVSGVIEKVPAGANKSFQIPIKQRDAAFALVREVTTR